MQNILEASTIGRIKIKIKYRTQQNHWFLPSTTDVLFFVIFKLEFEKKYFIVRGNRSIVLQFLRTNHTQNIKIKFNLRSPFNVEKILITPLMTLYHYSLSCLFLRFKDFNIIYLAI